MGTPIISTEENPSLGVSLAELEKALHSLEEIIQLCQNAKDQKTQSAFRDGAIQRFEYCIELSWKLAAKTLGSRSTTAKPVIREMAQNSLISKPDIWFDFVEARNKTSHSYDEAIAKQVFDVAVLFLPEGFSLLEELKTKK